MYHFFLNQEELEYVKMSEEKKYTYKCSTCDEIYEFPHVQTYVNCTKCEWKGELRLQSIEILKSKEDE